MSNQKSLAVSKDKEKNKEEFIGEFIALQEKEIEFKTEELKIRKEESAFRSAELKHNQAIAEKSISAQLEDSKLKQSYFLTANLRKSVLIGIAMLSVLGFLIFSMVNNNTDFAARLFDIIVGGLGGFAAGKGLSKKTESNSDE